MSLRELVDAECGGANPLMRLGNQIIHDAAHKDDGVSGRAVGPSFAGPSQFATQPINETNLVNEFMGQMSAPAPQTFRMDALLQEMREIDARNYPGQVVQAPPVFTEINNGLSWANEFSAKSQQFHASVEDEALTQINEQASSPLTLNIVKMTNDKQRQHR